MAKKQVKKLIAVLLVVSMIAGMCLTSASAVTFTDTNGHWAKTYIDSGITAGYIDGYSDGTFKPDGSVTRAEFAKMLVEALGITGTTTIAFKDVPAGKWYYSYVQKAVYAGFISGYSDNTFRPDNNITRQEAAAMISRIVTAPTTTKSATIYKDYASIDKAWALQYVETVLSKGYMTGDNNGNFRPNSTLTRGEAAKIITSILQTEKIVKVNQSISSAVSYSNTLFVNNVIIANSVGSGSVSFANCRVLGAMNIAGGGSSGISLSNTGVNRMTVAKSTGDVGITVSGSSYVTNTAVNYGATLRESSLSGNGFGDVTISGSGLASQTVSLSGTFDTVTMSSDTTLELTSGRISELAVNSGAAGSTIDMARNTTVTKATINASSSFTGEGKVINAVQNVANVTFETEPTTLTGTGVSAGKLQPTVSPTNAKTGVSPRTTITLTFKEALTNASGKTLTDSYIESSVVELRRSSSSGTKVSFEASINSTKKVITITPDSTLSEDTRYYVIVKANSLTNSSGTKNTAFSSYFVTGEKGVLEPEVSPADGKTNVSAGTKITLTFDEAIYDYDGDSITGSYIEDEMVELRRGSEKGTLVSFDGSINSTKKVVTITPTRDLSEDYTYYVIVIGGSITNRDDEENTEFVSSFTVGSDGVLIPETDPEDGEDNVSRGTDIVITFDEKIYRNDDGDSMRASDLYDIISIEEDGDLVDAAKAAFDALDDETKALVSHNNI